MNGHRPIIILSDDITGASGVASMIDEGAAITINIDHLGSSIEAGHECVCVNLGIRESGVLECGRILRSALALTGNKITALRIDSTLRGPIGQQVKAFLRRGNLLVTDTIPEYHRYTSGGVTIRGKNRIDIGQVLADYSNNVGNGIKIADSRSRKDLRELAKMCVENGLIPVDPGPLIAEFVKLKKSVLDRSLGVSRPDRIRKIAFVVGTSDPATARQLQYMKRLGYWVGNPRVKRPNKTDIYSFSFTKEKSLITSEFLRSLARYDGLLLSGGETANYVLKRSAFHSILNGKSIQPLVSTGLIKGGLLQGKLVVLKGGSIGDDKTYMRILDWMTGL